MAGRIIGSSYTERSLYNETGVPLPKLKPEELESRRQEIVDAARTCFLRSGFHRTTTDEICREASITPGGLYHYFGGKDEIIAAVIQQSATDVVERLHAMLEEAGDMRSAFSEVAAFFIETMHDPNIDNVTRLDIEIWAEALKNRKLYEISQEGWATRRRMMEMMVNRSAEEGLYSTKDVDARGLSSLLIAILVGMRIGKVLWQEDFDLNGAIAAMFLVHSGRLTVEMPNLNGVIEPVKKKPAKAPKPQRAAARAS
jgi:AcrR family transcriptional regulator